jgi:hypothetical protein
VQDLRNRTLSEWSRFSLDACIVQCVHCHEILASLATEI